MILCGLPFGLMFQMKSGTYLLGLEMRIQARLRASFFFFLQLLHGNDFPHPVPLFESRLVGDRNSEVRLAGLPSLLLKPNLAFYI